MRGVAMVRADSESFWQLNLRQQRPGVEFTRPGKVLTVFLMTAIFAGSMAAVLRSSFVGVHQAQKEKPGFAKIQDPSDRAARTDCDRDYFPPNIQL